MNSCNPYMIHLALEMGNSRFAYYQSLFGFGKITGIDLQVRQQVSYMVTV